MQMINRRYAPWWITAIGAVLLGVLYVLPRHVVDNDAEGQQPTQEATELAMHALPMDVDVSMQIVRWRALWQRERTWPWADSLAHTYLQYERTDSALHYARLLVRLNEKAALRQGALHLYRAYVQQQDSAQTQSSQLSLGAEVREQLYAAAEHYPREYALRTKAALTYLRTPNPMEGIQRLRTLSAEAPDDPDVLFALGRLSLQTGQYQKGEERLRKLLQLYPMHVEGMLYLGRYLMQNEQIAEGRALLERGRRTATDPAVLQIINTYLVEENQTR